MSKNYYITGLNMGLASFLMLLVASVLIAILMGNNIPIYNYLTVQILVLLAIVIGINFIPRFKRLNLRRYSFGIALGVGILLLLSVVSFYTRGAKIDDHYSYSNGGGSEVIVKSHSPFVAVKNSFSDPATFMAKFTNDCSLDRRAFSYSDCRTDYYLMGILISEGILIFGVATGTVLSKYESPSSKRDSNTSS